MALPLEPLSCSTAASERTNWTFRCILTPFSGGMNHSTLLERIPFEERSGQIASEIVDLK
jgi:hypothetical protein